MNSVERPQISERARKIVDQERQAIAASLEECRGRADSPSAALAAVCVLMNQRSRYFGVTGEHFPVQDYEGILVIDALDEALLKALRDLLHGWVRRQKRTTPELPVLKSVTER